MLKIITYSCSYCGLEYDTEEECTAHEEIHRNLKLNPGDMIQMSTGVEDEESPWVVIREVIDDAYLLSYINLYSDRLSNQTYATAVKSDFRPLYIIPKEDLLKLEEDVVALKRKYTEELVEVAGFARVVTKYCVDHRRASISLRCEITPEFKATNLSTGKDYKLVEL